jgi:hypothetical protein
VLATAAFVRGRGGLDLVEALEGYEALVVGAGGFSTTSGLAPSGAQAWTGDMSG